MNDVDPTSVARALAALWNSGGRGRVQDVFAESAVFRDVAFGVECRGLDQIRELFRGTWSGMPDLHTELRRIIPAREHVTVEWTLTGTHTGDFPDLPATDRSVELDGVSVIRVEGRTIVRQTDYYDRATFLEQLGIEGSAAS